MAFARRVRLVITTRNSVVLIAQIHNGSPLATKKLTKAQQKAPPPRHVENTHYGNVKLLGVAATMQLLANFEWPKPISEHAVNGVCSVLVDAKEKKSPVRGRKARTTIINGSTEYLDERVQQWQETGISAEELLRIVMKLKHGGRTPSREVYTEMLKIAMSVSHSHSGTQHSTAIVELLKLMCEDHGKTAGLEGLYSGAFFIASNESQLSAVWKRLNEIGVDFTNQGSQELLESYIAALCQGRAKHAINCFMREVVSKLKSPSVFTFETLLDNCLKSNELSRGINTYTCMIRTYGIAPTEKAYNLITSLLARNTENEVVTVQLCYRILNDAERVYFNNPPLWVYPRIAMPLIQLAGYHGYNLTMSLTRQKVVQYIKQQTPYSNTMGTQMSLDVASRALIQQFWNSKVFYSLLRRATLKGDANLALHLFTEMKSLGIPTTKDSYIQLLQAVERHEELDKYLSVLLQEPEITTSAADWLLTPLHRAINRIFNGHKPHLRRHTVNDGRMKDLLLLSAHQQIKSALSGVSHQYCLDHIANLGRRVAGLTNGHIEQSSNNGNIEQEVTL